MSEAAHGTFSSYHIQNEESTPTLHTITDSLADGGNAPCWVVTGPLGGIAYGVNSASATITSFTVSSSGVLTVLSAVAANTGSGSAPIDLALTGDGGFLYIISTIEGTLFGFRVENGTLSQVASVTGLPLSIQGIAAR